MDPIRRFSQFFFVSLVLVGSLATSSYAAGDWVLKGLTRVAHHLGPTGQVIVCVLVVLLIIGGIAYHLKKKWELRTKLALLRSFRQSPPADPQQAVRDLVRCFLMGPVEFTDVQADHNAAVLESLCRYVSNSDKTTLQDYIAKFRQRPAKFGLLESADMEKWIGALPLSIDTKPASSQAASPMESPLWPQREPPAGA